MPAPQRARRPRYTRATPGRMPVPQAREARRPRYIRGIGFYLYVAHALLGVSFSFPDGCAIL